MSSACISLILVLSVVFIILLISSLLKKQNSYIYTKVNYESDDIEIALREILWKNPDSEIVVVTYGRASVADKIIEMLKKDFPRIHIIKK